VRFAIALSHWYTLGFSSLTPMVLALERGGMDEMDGLRLRSFRGEVSI
jgi:hypothetical protein